MSVMYKRFFRVGLLLILILITLPVDTTGSRLTEEQKLVSAAWCESHLPGWRLIIRIGRRSSKVLKQPQEDQEVYEAIQQMLASLDDPFTRLLKPEQYHSLQVNTSGELTGVGLQIAQQQNNWKW